MTPYPYRPTHIWCEVGKKEFFTFTFGEQQPSQIISSGVQNLILEIQSNCSEQMVKIVQSFRNWIRNIEDIRVFPKWRFIL